MKDARMKDEGENTRRHLEIDPGYGIIYSPFAIRHSPFAIRHSSEPSHDTHDHSLRSVPLSTQWSNHLVG